MGVALCYHALAETEGDRTGELSAPVSRRRFEAHLRHLRRTYDIVPGTALPETAARRRRGGRLPVAITFDDDLASHLSHAAPALRAARLPATFFLTGAGLDGPAAFWWQLLQRAWDRGLVDEELLAGFGLSGSIRDVARDMQSMAPGERAAVTDALRERLGQDAVGDVLGREGVAALASGFEIGFHTREHSDLTTLDDEALGAALTDGRARLEEVTGPLAAIAYPHGRADARVAAAAGAAGFRLGFVADGEPVRAGGDLLLLGRRYPAEGPASHLALDLARTFSSAR